MEDIIVEVGMKLKQDLIYYHDMLINHGLRLVFTCITHDIYYTKQNLDGLTENEMKNACVRLRFIERVNTKQDEQVDLLKKEQELIKEGYTKVFDTIKIDFNYCNDNMKSRVQIQNIKDIGLLVYYDNPDYYKHSLDTQRKLLIDELNSYGFEFNDNDLGLDKLRTLYYKKEMYSKNQNG